MPNSLGTNTQINKYLENQVYLDLRRQNKKIYFYTTQDGYEVDFVTLAPDGTGRSRVRYPGEDY